MKGDFTRSTFDPQKRYSSVLTQQGRLPMDADWNEAQAIAAYLDEITRTDVIGPCGFPEDNAGFELVTSPDNQLAISVGRGYVDGILCENENADPTDDTPVLLTDQTDLPSYELPTDNVTYVAYLDVWKRHITALEDPNIKEVALGGPDTATRLKTVWQVKLAPLSNPNQTCEDFGPGWQPEDARGTSQLRSRSEPDPLADRPCIVPAQAGYRRLENQLYRVEIHSGGDADTATFKWSRDNGSIVSGWTGPDTPNTNKLTVTTVGRDSVLRFLPDQWVELSDDTRELTGTPGTLVQLEQADGQTLTLGNGATTSRSDFSPIPKVRRWDHRATVTRPAAGPTSPLALADDGALPVAEGVWILLEDGVQVWFEPGGTYQTGDCWMIPARTIGADVLWPKDDAGEPLLSDPHCIRHHYCALGLVARTPNGWNLLQDCRPLFPPLTDLPESGGCCLRVEPGEDVQRAVDRAIAAGGGCICLGHGVHSVEGPLRLLNANNISLSGETPITTLRLSGTDAAGLGGIVLQNASRIAFRQLLIVGNLTPAVLHLQANQAPSGADNTNREISLHNTTLINRSTFDNQLPPPCAILASDAQQVTIESTRLVAPIGILSRLGDRLPTDPLSNNTNSTDTFRETFRGTPEERSEEARVSIASTSSTITFSDVSAGTQFRLDETYPTPVANATFKPFVNQNNQSVESGTAQIINDNSAAGQQQWLQMSSISFQLAFAAPVEQVSLSYIHGPLSQEAEGFPALGNVNIAINGMWQNLSRLSSLNGQKIGGVTVAVAETSPIDTLRVGTLTLTGPVRELRLGGQHLSLANVQVSSAQAPAQPSTQFSSRAASTAVPTDIRLQDVTILYQRYGIWTMMAERWQVVDASLRPGLPPAFNIFDGDSAEVETPSASDDFTVVVRSSSSRLARIQQFVNALDQILTVSDSDVDSLEENTTAIKAFLWDDCQIINSELVGDRAVDTQLWQGGKAQNNRITSKTIGLYAFWLHKVQWTHNQAASGVAFAWVGCYRTHISHNQVRNSRLGIASGRGQRGFVEMASHLQEIRAFYTSDDDATPLVSWLLLTQLIPRLGLAPLIPPLQNLLTQLNIQVPVLYWLGLYFYPALSRRDSNLGQFFQAIIALQVEQNDIEATDACVRCRDFWTLGGLIVRDNRLHTVTGQALLLMANPLLVNTHLVSFLWRYAMTQLQVLIERTIKQLESQNNAPAISATLLTVIKVLSEQVASWAKASEGFLEVDNRVESNQIRSLKSAIATNLFEIAILNNHVTLQESPVSLKTYVAVVSSLSESPAMASVALALKDGSQRELATAVEAIRTENTFADAQSRSSAVTALSEVNNRTDDTAPQLRGATTQLITALSDNNASVDTAIEDFQQALSPLTNSYGILLEGIGGRIIGNQILAPADSRPDTWSRGGIHLSSNLSLLYVFIAFANRIQTSIFGDERDTAPVFDPLLGITETLLDNNEILGGVGHGVSVQGNDRLEILFKLKIRNNQIGGMGGAGIAITEDAMVVNLDIEGNRIANCANQPEIAALVSARGGLDVEGAVFCRVHQNRINGCGDNETKKLAFYAVNFKTILDLTFADNSVQYNRFGGVRCENVLGIASINNNEISQNKGTGFSWENAGLDTDESEDETSAPSKDLAKRQAITPALAIAQFNQLTNQSIAIPTGSVHASVQNNQFHVPDNENGLAFRLFNLSELIFSGNIASRPSPDPVGLIQQIEEGIIANNLLRNRV